MSTVLLFLGLPGSGKGTQASILCQRLNIKSYSLGDILRLYARSEAIDAKLVKNLLDNGEVVPANIVNKIVADILLNGEKLCILDGYPRTMEQADFLSKFQNLLVVPIYFNLSAEIIIGRILNRVQCVNCNKVYSSDVLVCEKCESKDFYIRNDDNRIIINKRIAEFNKNTLPVLDFYNKVDLLNEVDASTGVEQISQKLNCILERLRIDF